MSLSLTSIRLYSDRCNQLDEEVPTSQILGIRHLAARTRHPTKYAQTQWNGIHTDTHKLELSLILLPFWELSFAAAASKRTVYQEKRLELASSNMKPL